MQAKLIQLTQRFNGWPLILIIILLSVVMTETLVASLHWLIEGIIPAISLWVGLIAGVIVASVVATLATYLLNELAKTQTDILQGGLLRAEHNLNQAIESAQMIFWQLDFVTGELRYDDTQQNWLHITTEQAAHTVSTWLALVHPDDQAPFMAMFQRALAEETEFDFEYRMKGSDLNWVWVQTRGRVVQRNADGKPLLAAGGSLNIQARKNAERALQETKNRLQNIFNDNPDIMLISRLSDGHITDVNDAFVRASGYSRAEAIGQTTLSLKLWANGLDRERMTRELTEHGYCQHLEAPFHGRGQPPIMGSLVAVITALDGIPHILSTVRDISAEKQLEDNLKRSHTLLQTTLQSTDEGVLMVDSDGHALSTNLRFRELWRIPPQIEEPGEDELLLAYMLEQLRDPEDFLKLVHQLYTSDAEARDILHFKDGRVFARYSRALSLGETQGRIWCFKDISVQFDIEAELRRTKERYDFATHVGHVGTWDWNPLTGVLFWSDETYRLMGYTPGQVIPTYELYLGLLHPDDRELLNQAVQAALHQHEPYELDCRIVLGDAHEIACHVTGKVEFDANNQPTRMLGTIQNISARKQYELALQASEARAQSLYTLLRLITDNVSDMIWAKDLHNRYIFANQAMCQKLLNAHDTDEPIGRDDMFFALRERNAHPDDPHWHTFGEVCRDSDTLTLQNNKPSQFDQYGNVQGKFLFLDAHKAPLLNHLGEVIGVVGSARDVTEQKANEEKLRLASLVLQNSSEALIVMNEENLIMDVNPAFTQLTGYSLDEVLGKDPALLHSDRHDEAFYRNMLTDINATGRWQGEVWNRRKNGEIYAEWLTINTIHNEDGTVHRRVAMFSDITEKKKNEEIIWIHANFDPLTQLPNRRMFYDRLAQDMKKAHRAGLQLALLFLDLDRFKEVNDTLGHEVGDSLLVQAAQRISACVRESDTVARLGGDEFTIILADLDELSCVERITECILHTLNQPFELGNDLAYVSASIGITLYPDDATALETMLTNADQAMYVAKNAGRNRFSYFTNAMQEASLHRLHLLNDLRGAISGQQLQLYYQPIVTLATGDIHKAEALIRWFHPKRGLINPAEFIPLAEESGLIHEIGNWVFTQAAQQALQWLNCYSAPIQISINKSPVQFQDHPNHFHWQEHLQAVGLSGKHIAIEITEGLLLKNSPEVAAQLLAFRDAGIQISIDDFGTGYSALSYLKKLDIDYMKIDQSFICNLVTDASDRALTEAIVVMAHKLGLKVIAEGVETVEQRDLLRQIGCDYAQGYLYSRPIPAKDFEALLV
jgi:diguanylate cyclase (GGDEF)-like protein/PAS domain S-box-containing protein